MKKTLSYTIPLIAGFFACVPFIYFKLTPPLSWWPLIITCAGCAGMYLLFMEINPIIKGVSLLSFISCFFSNVPYLSFNAYVAIVFCCYFYIGAIKMKSWGPTFRMLKAVLVLNLLLIAAQFFSHDQLLNFGLTEITQFGVVGHHMQEASFIVIVSAFLIQLHPGFLIIPVFVALFCNSTWSVLCIAIGTWIYFPSKVWRRIAFLIFIGFVVMGVITHKFEANWSVQHYHGRMSIWKRTIELTNERALPGWGLGTYKVIFPIKSGLPDTPVKTAHNDWLQMLFEIGYPLFILFVGVNITTFLRLLNQYREDKIKYSRVLAGYSIIVVDMMVHFPMRMIQTVLLMLLFLAYCEMIVRRRTIHLE